jgi:hypothetical protein
MYSHMMVGSNDIARSKKFYDATFATMGGKPGMQDPKGRLIYMLNGSMFLVTPPIDGNPAKSCGSRILARIISRCRSVFVASALITEVFP